jgi:hypothetical protein
MVGIERLVHEFLRENGYCVVHDKHLTFWIEKWEISKDIQQTTFLAYIRVMNQKVWLKTSPGLINEADVKTFSIFGTDDFDRLLEYLKEREQESKAVMLSASTGWDKQCYTAV